MHDLTDERSWSNKADKTRYRTECLGTEDARPFIRQHQLIPSSSGVTRCAGRTPPPLSQGTSRIAAPTSWLHMRAGEKAGSHLPSCSPGSRWLLSLNEATPHLPPPWHRCPTSRCCMLCCCMLYNGAALNAHGCLQQLQTQQPLTKAADGSSQQHSSATAPVEMNALEAGQPRSAGGGAREACARYSLCHVPPINSPLSTTAGVPRGNLTAEKVRAERRAGRYSSKTARPTDEQQHISKSCKGAQPQFRLENGTSTSTGPGQAIPTDPMGSWFLPPG